MTIAVVQHDALAQGDGGPWSNTGTITFSPATAGNLLVVIASNTNASGQHLHAPSGYTRRSSEAETAASGGMAVLVATKVAAGGETSVSCAVFNGSDVASATDRTVLAFLEISGTWGGWVEDSLAHGGRDYTLPSLTPTAGIEALIVAATVGGNAEALSSGPTGFTALDDEATPAGASERINDWYRHIATTSGSYSANVHYVGDLDRFWSVQLYASELATAPTAEFSWSANETTVFFFDESTGTPTSWLWDFGDGVTSTSQNPTHIYASGGFYNVTLTATNAHGSDDVTHVVNVSDIPIEVGPDAGAATIEIYVHDPSGARWDEANWDEAEWSTAGWVDVTPESVDAEIRWGVPDASLGILSIPDASSWAINFLDPDRKLDPSNTEGPFYGDLVPFLPVRVNHDGYTIRTGVAERLSWGWNENPDLGAGFFRVTDNIARMANAKVPHDTTLSNTLYARAVDALVASGLGDITVLPLATDPAVVAWSDTGDDQSAWDWIVDAAVQVLYQPYIDRHNQLGFRPYASPVFKGKNVTDADLVNLVVVSYFAGNYSVVKAMENPGPGIETRELTPKPAYGARTYDDRIDKPTPNAGDWAQAVLEDRSLTSLRWVPGEAYPTTPERTRELATVEAVELLGVINNSTDPAVAVDVIVLGGTIRLQARTGQTAQWWISYEAAQTAETPLVEDGSDPPEFLFAENGGEYLYRDV